jgi:hypothetical protein
MSGRNPRVSAKAATTRDLTVEAVGDPVNWCSTPRTPTGSDRGPHPVRQTHRESPSYVDPALTGHHGDRTRTRVLPVSPGDGHASARRQTKTSRRSHWARAEVKRVSVRDPYGTRSKTKSPGGRSSSNARTRVHNHAVPLGVATSGNAAYRAVRWVKNDRLSPTDDLVDSLRKWADRATHALGHNLCAISTQQNRTCWPFVGQSWTWLGSDTPVSRA